MDPVYALAFLVFFELVLLISLSLYYRRLRYRFLKYGALALAVEVVIQFVGYSGVLHYSPPVEVTVEGLAEILYTILLLACVADIADRPFPRRWAAAMAVACLLIPVAIQLDAELSQLDRIAVEIPSTLLLAVCVLWLVRYRTPDSIGSSWLAGVIVMHAGLVWSLPFLSAEILATGQIQFLDNMMLLLVGVALVMITSERTVRDLLSKDRRIEEYALERRRLELQFSQAQKLESLGVLAGGIAHDFNNMLTSILGYASLAMKKLPTNSEVRKDLYMVMSGARQAVDLTSQMLIYSGKGALDFAAVDISEVADDMSSLIHSIVPKKIQLVQRLGRDLPALKGNSVQLGQVLMNLVANAVDAIEGNTGTIEISTGLAEVDGSLLRASYFSEEREPGAYLFLRVKDTGIGIDADQIERIFDPFYSEKHSRKGLGLSSLAGIVRQHKGFIRVVSKPGEGTGFSVFFPAVSYQESAASGRFMVRSPSKIKGDVLVADDDPRIRTLMTSILESDSFRPTSAEDGKEALRIFEERSGQFDLLVLDCTMPKMSGPEVYRKIRTEGSTIPVVLVSGYHQEQVISSISNDPNAYFVKKPFNVDEFLREIINATGANQTV